MSNEIILNIKKKIIRLTKDQGKNHLQVAALFFSLANKYNDTMQRKKAIVCGVKYLQQGNLYVEYTKFANSIKLLITFSLDFSIN